MGGSFGYDAGPWGATPGLGAQVARGLHAFVDSLHPPLNPKPLLKGLRAGTLLTKAPSWYDPYLDPVSSLTEVCGLYMGFWGFRGSLKTLNPKP